MALGQVHTDTVGHVEPTIRQTALEPSIKNYREQLDIETDDMIGCVVNEQKRRHFGKKKCARMKMSRAAGVWERCERSSSQQNHGWSPERNKNNKKKVK